MIESLLQGIELEEVEEGNFSCLGRNDRHSSYDTKVNAYDAVVGNPLYNRIVWGNWPSSYRTFCRQALMSTPGGTFLDAGCGSLVFTAKAYLEANNKWIVLLDRSIGMLRKGRARIKKLAGVVPKNVVFMQGDIFHLPFRDGVFDTVASFGVLHLFDEKVSLLAELKRVKRAQGQAFFSSLVGNNAVGRNYLQILRKSGEVATCHSSAALNSLLSSLPFEYKLTTVGNMAYGKSA